MRMIGRDEQLVERRVHRLDVGLDLHAQHLAPLAAIDRQHAMRRDLLDLLVVVEVVAERLELLLQGLLLLQLRLVELRRLGPGRFGGRPEGGFGFSPTGASAGVGDSAGSLRAVSLRGLGCAVSLRGPICAVQAAPSRHARSAEAARSPARPRLKAGVVFDSAQTSLSGSVDSVAAVVASEGAASAASVRFGDRLFRGIGLLDFRFRRFGPGTRLRGFGFRGLVGGFLRRRGSLGQAALGRGRDLVGHELAGPLQDLAEFLAQVGPFAELLGQDVPGSQQGVGRAGDAAVRG